MGQDMSRHGHDINTAIDTIVSDDDVSVGRNRTSNIPPIQGSSDDSDDEPVSSSFQEDRTFRNILAVLVGRRSLGLSTLHRRYQRDTTSESESENDDELWGYSPQPAKVLQTKTPDVTEIEKAEISVLTQRSLSSGTKIRPNNLPRMLADRSLYGKFSLPDKRRICGQLLPHNPTKVAEYKSKVFCGTHAKDGEIFMTACQDRKIRIYDSSREKFILKKTIEAQDVGWSILDVAVSPDGEHLVYASWSDSLHQVSLFGCEQKHETLPLCPDNQQFCIFSVSFSSDSRELLGGANDGFLYIYDREANRQSARIEAHEDDVNAVCFVDETTHVLASAGDDGMCKVWDRRSLREDDPQPVGVLAGHVDGITYIDPRKDGRHLITNSKDQSIKLWDIRKFSGCSTIEMSKKAVSNQRWDYRWQRFPRHVMGTSRTPLEGDTSVMTYTGHTVLQTLIRCHFSPQFYTGQKFIYTGCAAGQVVIYDLLTGKINKVLSGHKSCVRDVSWSPYGRELFSSSWDFSVIKWDGVETPDKEEEKYRTYDTSTGTFKDKLMKPCLE